MKNNEVLEMTIAKLKAMKSSYGISHYDFHVENTLLECIRLLSHCPDAYSDLVKNHSANKNMDFYNRVCRGNRQVDVA